MSITHLTSVSQLDGILSKSSGKLSVIDFHATWCGPCHMIAPVFEALAKQYPNVNFLKCDVDAARDVASLYRISAMPTFVFLKGSIKVDEIQGANRSALQAAVAKHSTGSPSSSSAFSGKGQTLGSSSSTPSYVPVPRDLVNGASSIDPQVKILLALLGAYFVFWYMS
ncbi:thioredoxin-domain-containing protein [Punctularia strigosozonata HHB-11173 SS5]|uniref:thioredoxin-domain-containing protein n=1 Tax=Punctularia strigosozonata (strain HHB-11173) TaxID=741275 RepID=UPI0004416BF0|nr:thioredoxin-domain-containing protein [Punctularia strigosozonata HHB-11173 SS5]EIN13911.1 thioredoxin-domain-containing protein [Punctularia strigosozonata HHB-11173 SS5]